MSTWRGQTDAKKIVYEDDDDDWDTEADFVNDVTEKEQRWGSKTVENSLTGDRTVNIRQVREDVTNTHAQQKKEEYLQGPKASDGYGGKFGVQRDRMDKSAGSWSHNEEISKHSSVTDVAKGFGGKYGIEKDRVDKTSLGYDHQTELSKHHSQTDATKGFGGKFGVQKDRQDKSAMGYDHQTELSKHHSQTDAAKGFGGRYGVQRDSQDKSAMGYDHQTELSKHHSQTDAAKGFGGKFGVQRDSQDKSSLGFDHKTELSQHHSQTDGAKGFGGKFGLQSDRQDKPGLLQKQPHRLPESAHNFGDGGGPLSGAGYKTAIDVKGDVKNSRSRFENFEGNQEDDTKKKLEEEKKRKENEKKLQDEKRRQDEDRERQEDAKRREEETMERQEEENRRLEEEEGRRKEDEQTKQADERQRQEAERREEEKRQREEEKRQREEEVREQRQREDEEEYRRIEEAKKREEQQRKAEEELAKQAQALSISVAGKRATAVFDYTAGDGDELSFVQGDIISNVEMPDDGWWVGEIDGRKGMFPAAYVTLNEDESPDPVKPKRESRNAGPPDDGVCGVALYSYQAADTDELTFDEGERITNVEKPDEGWWLGMCRGSKGIFPASYITIQTTGSAPPSSQDFGLCGKATYSYVASDSDELSLVEGARVTNIDKIDEGWWMGQYDGNKGIFPASYIELEQ